MHSLSSQIFSILHAGGRSLFRFQTSKRVPETLGLNSRSSRPRPSIATLEGAGPKCHIVGVYNLKYEKFWENLKIHAGGDGKLRIQFAWPYSNFGAVGNSSDKGNVGKVGKKINSNFGAVGDSNDKGNVGKIGKV